MDDWILSGQTWGVSIDEPHRIAPRAQPLVRYQSINRHIDNHSEITHCLGCRHDIFHLIMDEEELIYS